MHGSRSVVVAAMLALGLALLPNVAAACTLTELPGNYEHDFAKADVVFTGTAVAVEDAAPEVEPAPPDLLRWTFAVDGVEKGHVDLKQDVQSSRSGMSCGYPFELGERYRVFANVTESQALNAGTHTGVQQLPPLAETPSAPVPGALILLATLLAVGALVSYRAFRR